MAIFMIYFSLLYFPASAFRARLSYNAKNLLITFMTRTLGEVFINLFLKISAKAGSGAPMPGHDLKDQLTYTINKLFQVKEGRALDLNNCESS